MRHQYPGGLTYGVAYPGLIWHHRYAVPFRHSNNNMGLMPRSGITDQARVRYHGVVQIRV